MYVRVGGHEVDFLWASEKLIVVRDAELQALGYRVMRVTWRQLVDEPQAVIARLAAALALSAAA